MPEPGSKNPKSSSKKKPKSAKSKTVKTKLPKAPKSKKTLNLDDGIAKSKQLQQRQKSSVSSSGCSSKSRTTNNEIRLCGNGKPMPSLAELEKMFEDSDSDDESKPKAETKPNISTTAPSPTPTPSTPEALVKLTSPKTIERIANRMLDLVSNLTEPPILLDDDGPPPPIIKPKKRKKSGIPYIVGCKDRDYVPSKPNNSVFKGEEEYGLEGIEEDDEDDAPTKRAKRTKRVNLSKSIFNAASDEIASRLKELDGANSDGSSDSNKTVAYEYYSPNTSNRPKSFSPLPSTSRDNETFVKNDQLFNESLISDNSLAPSMEDDLEIVETPCETIVINDTIENKSPLKDSTLIEVDDYSLGLPDDKNIEVISNEDDSIQLVDIKPASPIPVDDYYSSCNVNTASYNDDVCEVIDVDDIIAENTAIIKKYKKKEDLDTVTLVDLNNSTVSNTDTSSVQTVNENNPTNNSVIKSIANSLANVPLREQTNDEEIKEIQKILDLGPTHCEMVIKAIKTIQNIYSQMPAKSSTNNNPASPDCQVVSEETTGRTTLQQKAPSTEVMNSPEAQSKRIGDCPICMESLSSKSVASTMCGHVFCMNCIKLAIKSNGRKCPTCRKSLRGAGFHQVFL